MLAPVFTATASLFLAATDIHVALPAFTGTGDVGAQKLTFFVEYLSEQLVKQGGITVSTPSQIAAVLGMERQRELMGCGADGAASCLTELAGALGAEAMIIGTVARIGDEFALSLKAIDAKTGAVLSSGSTRARQEEKLLDFLSVSVELIRADLRLKLRGTAEARSKFGPLVWAPLGIGLGSGAGSAALFLIAKGQETRLRNNEPPFQTYGDVQAASGQGRMLQTTGAILSGIAATAVATAAVMYFFGDKLLDAPKPAQVTP